MKKRYYLIGVEGNHDQAFISKVLQKFLDFQQFKGCKEELATLWRKFIPVYPSKSGQLFFRLDMPSLLNKTAQSVAIYVGEGSKLIDNLRDKLCNIDTADLHGICIIADADNSTPSQVAKKYYEGLREIFPDFPQDVSERGAIAGNSPRLGLYVLPNNTDRGTLETILYECGNVAYPEYMKRAESYIDQFSEQERKTLKWKPFDREKAIIATVVSVLKPGKTNTVSISDNNWVSEESAQKLIKLQNLVSFLRDFLNYS